MDVNSQEFSHVLPEDDKWDRSVSPLMEDFLAVDTEPRMTSTAVKLGNSIAAVVGAHRHLRRVAWMTQEEADESHEIDLEEALLEDSNEYGRPAADIRKRSDASTNSARSQQVPPSLPDRKRLDDPETGRLGESRGRSTSPSGGPPSKKARVEASAGGSESAPMQCGSVSSAGQEARPPDGWLGPQVRPITDEDGSMVEQVVRIVLCRMADIHDVAEAKPDLVEKLRSFPGRWVRQPAAGRPGQNKHVHALLSDRWPLKPFAGPAQDALVLTEEETATATKHMQAAIALARKSRSMGYAGTGVVIVDPESDTVRAVGMDRSPAVFPELARGPASASNGTSASSGAVVSGQGTAASASSGISSGTPSEEHGRNAEGIGAGKAGMEQALGADAHPLHTSTLLALEQIAFADRARRRAVVLPSARVYKPVSALVKDSVRPSVAAAAGVAAAVGSAVTARTPASSSSSSAAASKPAGDHASASSGRPFGGLLDAPAIGSDRVIRFGEPRGARMSSMPNGAAGRIVCDASSGAEKNHAASGSGAAPGASPAKSPSKAVGMAPASAVARGHSDAAAATDYLFTASQVLEPIPQPGTDTGLPLPEQYLCTGYDVYCTVEPAPMECMSLVHARVRRVFVGCANPDQGALFSRMRLQEVQRMNHKYAVYRCKQDGELRAASREAAAPLLGQLGKET